MCGRIARGRADYALRFGFEEESETRLGYNIGPMQMDFFVRGDEDRRRAKAWRRGLVPVWAKEASIGSKMFNARAETLLERPSYHSLVAAHRCIIPASGFYEWQKSESNKTPMFIHRADGQPLALAGLWSAWKRPDGESLTSLTIITYGPNTLITDIHNRMPAIIDDSDLDAWLDPAYGTPADVLTLLRSFREEALTAYAVAPMVNSIRSDGPELILPLASS